jgi:flagellar biosynthesis/type III secretory pathway protein FliH
VQTETEPEHPVEQLSEEVELVTELISTEDESDTSLAQTEPEEAISPEPELDVAPGLDTEAVTQLIEAAREEARTEARAEAHAAGFQEGLEAGMEQAKAELQASFDEKLAVLDQMVQGLHQLERDPNALFEPMKKLSMHLAQQLVRGELTQSPQVISRLVDNCLRELAGSGEKAVIVHLNPEDLEQYKPLTAQFGDSIVLRPDALLSRGSVRASLDGSVVEDLIERRIKGLTKSLSQPIASGWRPALGATSVKTPQSIATKPAVATTPVAPAEPADPVEALDHDENNFSDDDDVISDDASIDDVNNSNTDIDRNDETHS